MYDITNFLHKINDILDSSSIICDPILKIQYETDWNNRYVETAIAVLFPSSVVQIQQIVNLCQLSNVGIVPQGGNTSKSGASVPGYINKPQIILNLAKLNQILAIDTMNNSILVEAGCTLKAVTEAALQHDRYFPLYIASNKECQIGGNIATNAGGIHVIKYGAMRNLVFGLEVVLPNGQIINQIHQLYKNNTNFDLNQLFIGSEGTLGIITKASLKLSPKPQGYCAVMLGLTSLDAAVVLLRQLQAKYDVCAFEILNKEVQQLYSRELIKHPIPVTNEWVILFELEVDNWFHKEELEGWLQSCGIKSDQIRLAINETERDYLWFIRENIALVQKNAGLAIKHDISLPIDKISLFIKINQQRLESLKLNVAILVFGHLGDGNLHYNIQFYGFDSQVLQQVKQHINKIVYEDVMELGGSISAEHGIGQFKKDWFYKYYDKESYNLALALKKVIDPANILNPSKIFDI